MIDIAEKLQGETLTNFAVFAKVYSMKFEHSVIRILALRET